MRLAEALDAGYVVVKSTSHRSNARLRAIIGPDPKAMFSFDRAGQFYAVPAEQAEAALAVTGVTRSRRTDDLRVCWGQ